MTAEQCHEFTMTLYSLRNAALDEMTIAFTENNSLEAEYMRGRADVWLEAAKIFEQIRREQ